MPCNFSTSSEEPPKPARKRRCRALAKSQAAAESGLRAAGRGGAAAASGPRARNTPAASKGTVVAFMVVRPPPGPPAGPGALLSKPDLVYLVSARVASFFSHFAGAAVGPTLGG